MPFNSIQYLSFFIAVFVLIRFCAGRVLVRNLVLLAASFYFYWSNNGWTTYLLCLCIVIDYAAGILIESAGSPLRRRTCLTISIIMNLGMLCFFKYTNFFIDTARSTAGWLGWQPSWVDLNIILPLGISFYTFESMSYTIDVYRGRIKAERSWIRFAAFIGYFPKLVAGPIIRPHELLPQFRSAAAARLQDLEDGLFRIALGLTKKIVFADFLARYSDLAFDRAGEVSVFQSWLGLYCFAFQIYFDFSGYSDIAIGCSRLLGFRISENFNRPYAAASFSDFWKRWHISLSSWLRDYLYIPLGGNRMRTKLGVYRNLALTMLLGGLWHGAAWHFVLWGALHGAYLVAEHALRDKVSLPGLARRLAPVAVFHFVLAAWIAFRAPDLEHLGAFLGNLFAGVHAPVTVGEVLAAVLIAAGWYAQILCGRIDLAGRFSHLPLPLRAEIYAVIAVLVTVFGSAEYRQFIYFEF